MFEYLVARMQEPSTYVSLGVLLTGLGYGLAPEYWQAISTLCLSVGGLAGVLIRERKKTTPDEIKEVVKDVVIPAAVQKGE